jgi:hypothetical protein
VVEPTRIEDVTERVRDFTTALREAGAEDIARRIDGYALGFVDSTQVRRSVDAIKHQLRYFRMYPHELPDLPKVQIAANRLEDVCKEALRAGIIAPARLSLRSHARRKLAVALTTLASASACLLAPLALSHFGVDLSDALAQRTLPPVQLRHGASASVPVNVLVESREPSATLGVEFSIAGGCARALPHNQSCRAVAAHAPGDDKTGYEIMREDQAYGLTLAFSDTRLIGAVGTGVVHVSASADTPEGRYELPLTAAFVGYAQARCNPWRWLQNSCESAQHGPHARDEPLPVPRLIVEVVPGVAADDLAAAQAQAAEQLRRAEARASQIGGAVAEIRDVLDDTQSLLRRKQYDAARQRIDKLNRLFAPLDALALAGTEAEPLPAEVVGLRARFEAQQHQLAAFEDQAFDDAYDAFAHPRAPGETDELVLTRVAHKLGIEREFLEAIYAEHADQLEARVERAHASERAREQQKADALLKRCGELPKTAWRQVQTYLAGMAHQGQNQLRLNECFTPRLDARSCWSVVCDFDDIVAQPDLRPNRVVNRHWTFLLRDGNVVDHVVRVVERP